MNSPTSRRGLEANEKRRKALELRKAGASFDSIAQEVGYASKSGAYKAVRTALIQTLREPAAEVRTLELERLDRLYLVAWAQALKGDLKAVDRCLQIMRQRALLEGLNIEKLALTDPTGEKPYANARELFEQIEQYADEFEAVRAQKEREEADEEVTAVDLAMAGFGPSATPGPTEPGSKQDL